MAKQLIPYRPMELLLDSKLTDSSFNDFIGVWPKFVPKPFCDKLIKFGNGVLDGNLGDIVCDDALIKQTVPPGSDDTQTKLMDGALMYGGKERREDQSFLVNYTDANWMMQINQFLKSCMMHYIHEFAQLKNVSMCSTDQKFQRTPPGGGYHLWHYENASFHFAQRECVWMIYLNDIEEGGETEFLYQRKRFKPTAGTVVIWPAAFTHTHRGNLVLGEQYKYILTGWYIKTGAL